jgi:hypothetical protein
MENFDRSFQSVSGARQNTLFTKVTSCKLNNYCLISDGQDFYFAICPHWLCGPPSIFSIGLWDLLYICKPAKL